MRAEQAKARANRAENRVYFFLRFLAVAVFPIAKSSSFFPSLIAATSHRGFAPRPAQVLPALSRYFAGTFLPFSELPRPLLGAISPPNLASWLRSSVLLRLSFFARTLNEQVKKLARQTRRGIPPEFTRVASDLNQSCGAEDFKKAWISIEWMNGCLNNFTKDAELGFCSRNEGYSCAINARSDGCVQRR